MQEEHNKLPSWCVGAWQSQAWEIRQCKNRFNPMQVCRKYAESMHNAQMYPQKQSRARDFIKSGWPAVNFPKYALDCSHLLDGARMAQDMGNMDKHGHRWSYHIWTILKCDMARAGKRICSPSFTSPGLEYPWSVNIPCNACMLLWHKKIVERGELGWA